MKDFYESEKFRLQLAVALTGVAYVLTLILLWLRLKHLYGSFVYSKGSGGPNRVNIESFVAWLTPWCVYLAITALVMLCAVVMVIYIRCFSGKNLCVDCLLMDVRNFTKGHDEVAREFVCPTHMEFRIEQMALSEAMERARAEKVGVCPTCQLPMRKAIQRVLGIYVVSHICQADGRFSHWPEIDLFTEAAYQAGMHARISGKRGTEHHAVTAAALSADTSPIMFLDELDGLEVDAETSLGAYRLPGQRNGALIWWAVRIFEQNTNTPRAA